MSATLADMPRGAWCRVPHVFHAHYFTEYVSPKARGVLHTTSVCGRHEPGRTRTEIPAAKCGRCRDIIENRPAVAWKSSRRRFGASVESPAR